MTMGGTTHSKTVLSVEQALALPYATLRCVHQGWRVIRVEAPPVSGRERPGDPNRYIGHQVAGADRLSYFVGPNVGKEAIVVDLKQAAGRAVLQRLLQALDVDVFCTNTLPIRHEALGIDYKSLSAIRPDLIWCAISALGTDHPDVAGYDPVIQAMCGCMDITGHRDGPPLLCGVPIADLKAGDEAFTQLLLAMMHRAETGEGKRIDISMAQAITSWLQTILPLLDMGSPPDELRRTGNEHRQFFPVNVFPTRDGHLYIAIGSDAQWHRLIQQPLFAELDEPRYASNAGRRAHKDELNFALSEIMANVPIEELLAAFRAADAPHHRVTPIESVTSLPTLSSRLLTTTTPDGKTVRLPPPASSSPHLDEQGRDLPFAPAYGEHTDAILAEVGFPGDMVAELRTQGVIH